MPTVASERVEELISQLENVENGKHDHMYEACHEDAELPVNTTRMQFMSENSKMIPEEEAICRFCNHTFKGENVIMLTCKCNKNTLAHESCSDQNNKNCDGCEQDLQKLPVTLHFEPDSAHSRKHKNKKGSLASCLLSTMLLVPTTKRSSSSVDTVAGNDNLITQILLHLPITSLLRFDLITQILLHLPITSLLRFKSVSKHWLSLITNPAFARLVSKLPMLLEAWSMIVRKENTGNGRDAPAEKVQADHEWRTREKERRRIDHKQRKRERERERERESTTSGES
ncbi:hypothetical protein LguiB_013363 [Lonicera macranthoides]